MKICAKTDFWLGISILAGGMWVYNQSQGFDEASKSYPLFLSVVTTLLGAGITLQAFKQQNKSTASIQWLYSRMKGSLLIVLLFAFWAILLTTKTGYLMSSVLTLMPLLYLLGYKKFSRLILSSFGIAAAVFTLFYIVFDVPLPLNPFVEHVFGLLN